MSKYLGDFGAGDTLDFKFTTFRPSTGAPFTLAGTPAVSVYKDNSTTQSTAGVTLTVDFDSVTGLHHVRITTASDGTFYADGSAFECVITAGTVDSVSVVGSCVGRFTLRDQACLYPTTHARKLDVTTTGEAGIDWANIGSPTTTVNFTGTTISTGQTVTSVSGSVGSVASGGITTGSFASGAINAAAIATDAVGSDEISAAAAIKIADALLNRSMSLAGAANNINITSIVSNVFQATNSLVVDDRVVFIGTAPNSFSLGVIYWVTSTSLSSTTFTLATTQGGLPSATSSTGAFTAAKVTDRTVLSAIRYLRNKVDISGSTMTIYQEDDSAAAWTAALTTTAGVNPVTTVDPT